MATSNKHIEFTQKILGFIESGQTNIIADIAADSLTELRRKTAQNAIKTREELDAVIAAISAEIEVRYDGKLQERQRELFANELLRVEHALKTGSAKGVIIDRRKNDEGPNTFSPERQLLWHVVWTHMENLESVGTSMIKHELADSKGMRAQLDEFAYQLGEVLGMVGSSKKQCEIIWGDKGSGYYHAQKAHNPELQKDRINIDLHGTLGEGQHVLQIMLHEFMHHLIDRNYPQHLEEMQKRIMELFPRYEEGTLSDEELEEFKALVIKRNLAHRVWNSAADNAVDNGSLVLARGFYTDTDGGFPKVDPSLLINSFTTRGMGNSYIRLQNPEAQENSPLVALLGGGKPNPVTALSNSLFVISQIHHGLVPNTPEGLASIDIDPEPFKHKDHPEWTAKQNWQFLWDKCQDLMQHVPSLRGADMLDKQAWLAQRDAAEKERNKIHAEIFAAYVEPHLEQIVEQQKKNEELMKELMKMLGNLPKIPGASKPGQGGGISIPGGLGEGEPMTVEQGGKNKVNGTHDEPDHGESSHKPKLGGGDFAKPSAPRATAGSGTDALIDLPLGDGRTLKELQHDPQIKRAINHLANEIVKLYRDTPIYQMGHGTNSYTLTPQGGSIPELFDRDKHRRVLQQGGKRALNDFKGFMGEEPVAKIPAVGDFIMALDTSGSMGWGKNSNAEHAIKAAAILTLAIQKANKILMAGQDPGPEIGAYVMLWGNTKPSYLTKPYDRKSTETMIKQFDELLDCVWNNKAVDGAHGGTEMVGVIKAIGHEYATDRPKEKRGYYRNDFRGPVSLTIFSDGGVFDIDRVPVAQLLKDNPYMTWDTALTGGLGSPLHAAMQAATAGARKHQTPLCTEISTNGDLVRHLADMMHERVKSLQIAFRTKNIFPVTNAQVEKAFGENLVAMGEPVPRRRSHLAEVRARSNTTEIG